MFASRGFVANGVFSEPVVEETLCLWITDDMVKVAETIVGHNQGARTSVQGGEEHKNVVVRPEKNRFFFKD